MDKDPQNFGVESAKPPYETRVQWALRTLNDRKETVDLQMKVNKERGITRSAETKLMKAEEKPLKLWSKYLENQQEIDDNCQKLKENMQKAYHEAELATDLDYVIASNRAAEATLNAYLQYERSNVPPEMRNPQFERNDLYGTKPERSKFYEGLVPRLEDIAKEGKRQFEEERETNIQPAPEAQPTLEQAHEQVKAAQEARRVAEEALEAERAKSADLQRQLDEAKALLDAQKQAEGVLEPNIFQSQPLTEVSPSVESKVGEETPDEKLARMKAQAEAEDMAWKREEADKMARAEDKNNNLEGQTTAEQSKSKTESLRDFANNVANKLRERVTNDWIEFKVNVQDNDWRKGAIVGGIISIAAKIAAPAPGLSGLVRSGVVIAVTKGASMWTNHQAEKEMLQIKQDFASKPEELELKIKEHETKFAIGTARLNKFAKGVSFGAAITSLGINVLENVANYSGIGGVNAKVPNAETASIPKANVTPEGFQPSTSGTFPDNEVGSFPSPVEAAGANSSAVVDQLTSSAPEVSIDSFWDKPLPIQSGDGFYQVFARAGNELSLPQLETGWEGSVGHDKVIADMLGKIAKAKGMRAFVGTVSAGEIANTPELRAIIMKAAQSPNPVDYWNNVRPGFNAILNSISAQ